VVGWPSDDPVQPRDFAAAAALLVPFALVLLALTVAAPATAAQHAASDPLIQLSRGAWPVIPITAIVVGAWLARARPDGDRLRRAALLAGAGAAVSLAVAGGLYAVVGDQLPSFIPPEESARAGLTHGLAAGVLEEVVFRLAVLPGLYALLRRRLPPHPSIGLAALGTGLLFSLSHELGPAGGVFDPGFLATRTLFPGLVMSLVALRIHPAFIVTAHCTGHLAIPALFR